MCGEGEKEMSYDGAYENDYPPFNDIYDEGYRDDDDFDEEEEFDCGMDRSGYCGKAGSEECDWECPYSNELC
jgi:hypothetical protein